MHSDYISCWPYLYCRRSKIKAAGGTEEYFRPWPSCSVSKLIEFVAWKGVFSMGGRSGCGSMYCCSRLEKPKMPLAFLCPTYGIHWQGGMLWLAIMLSMIHKIFSKNAKYRMYEYLFSRSTYDGRHLLIRSTVMNATGGVWHQDAAERISSYEKCTGDQRLCPLFNNMFQILDREFEVY